MQARTASPLGSQMLARGGAPTRLWSTRRLTSSRVCCTLLHVSGCDARERSVKACEGGAYVSERYCNLASRGGAKVIPTPTGPQTLGGCAPRCFCCLRRKEADSSLTLFDCARVLPIDKPKRSTTISLGPPHRSVLREALNASASEANASGIKAQDALQPVPPVVPEGGPLCQVEIGDALTGAKDPSRSPQALVAYLDNYIVGQESAKRAVAVALRQRWRRRQVADAEMRADITPKNILLIGPTGVGKTEIARRLAKHLDAPFLKVEATKYTEVGFHGRDVDQIIKDLMEVAVKQKKAVLEAQMRSIAEEKAEAKVLEALAGKMPAEEYSMWLRHLRRGSLDSRRIQIDMPMPAAAGPHGALSDLESAVREMKDTRYPSLFANDFRMVERRYVTIKEALTRLTQAELDTLITKDMVIQQAVESVEQEGIVFIDEIDKICSKGGSGGYHGPDASDEGVQRDLLPLLEGSTVATRFGEVKTDYILFIASGAFHSVRPSDMLAELQGRLPVRVTLSPLTEEDFRQILTKTKNNLIEQHKALLSTEGVVLEFRDDAIAEVARVAWEVNSQTENIGARRLHTVIEKVLEEVNLNASLHPPGTTVVIDREHVAHSVSALCGKLEHSRFIL